MSLPSRLLAAVAYAADQPVAPWHPYRMVLEISNHCNLKCTFCPRTTSMQRPIAFMEPETFERVLSEHKGHLENVSLNGYGEPLLHPRMAEFVALAHKHNVGVSISTNCTVLNEKRARMILDAGVDHVTLAIDGIEKELYESVRVGADFPTVVENARRFLMLKHRSGARTLAVVQCIAMTQTKQHLRNIHAFWRDAHADAIRIRQLTHSGLESNDPQFVNDRGSCYWLWVEPMMLADGRVVACCQDVDGALTLGNIHEQPLAEIWSGTEARRLRQLHAEGRRDEIPFCKGCNMYQPSRRMALAAAPLGTNTVNRIVPRVETVISKLRYHS